MTPEKYCEKIVKKSGSNFYYSFFFLPRRKRRAIYAFYAFSRVADDIVDEPGEMADKEKGLAFWRREIASCYDGTADHPLTRELSYLQREFAVPREYLEELLNGLTMDLIQTRYATFSDLKRYCYRVASVVGLVCLKIFEVEDSLDNREAAINLGWAFQLTNILRDVEPDAAGGRIYLPEEDMQNFGVTADAIFTQTYDEKFVRLIACEWERAHECYVRAWQGFDKRAQKKLLPAMIMADIYYDILLQIRARNYNVFGKRLRVSKLKKLMFAFSRWGKAIF